MSAESKCRECGTIIPAESSGGFCPQCLLNLGLQEAAPPSGAESSGSASSASPATERTGDRIGRYRLLQEIGHGGCGVVYMAEQEEPVRRKVALKVIKLGMDTKQVVARFEAERQALALMDHSSITKVLDAGATETGRPYFVMELVGGIKITDYCNQNQLTTRQRLDLFIQVCLAVQHAHQKGVIHRDLKPSNVLVAIQDGVPVPKVIDFGIAKATQGRLTDQTVFTAFEQFLGTPAYMSPEQAQLGGLDVDTRSDIYSLGVLLYELLAGKTPFDTKELMAAGLDEMRRTIREVEPIKPSTRLTSELVTAPRQSAADSTDEKSGALPSRRYGQIQELVHSVRGDLDWIVMKCLEKDRARRYESANGLARDIERHLSDEPVVAGPPDNLYRFQKMVQRNKLAFAATGGVVVALVVGLAIALWQSVEKTRAYNRAHAAEQEATAARTRAEANEKKAQTEAARSEQVAMFLQEMLKSVGPSVANGRDTEMLRDILDKAAERVGTELTNQPEVEADLRNTIGFAYWELGAYEKAELMFRQCRELLRRNRSEERLLADTLHKLADLLRADGDDWTDYKYIEAEEMEREVLAIYTKLHGREHPTVADSLHNLAGVLSHQGKLDAAEAAALESVAINRKAFDADHPNIGVCLGQLGIVLLYQGRLAEAESVLQDTVAILRKALGKKGSFSGLNPEVELGWALHVQARLREKQGKWDEAVEIQGEALAMLQKVQGNDNRDVIFVTIYLAKALAAQSRLHEAELLLREQIAALKQPLGDNHPRVNQALKGLARLLQKHGKFAEAEEVWREEVPIQKNLSGQQHPIVAHSLQELALALHYQGKFAEAEVSLRESLLICEKSLPDAWQTFNTKSELGGALLGQKKYADAAPLLLSGYEGMKEREARIPADDKLRLKEALERLLQLSEATDRPDQAAEWNQKLAEFDKTSL